MGTAFRTSGAPLALLALLLLAAPQPATAETVRIADDRTSLSQLRNPQISESGKVVFLARQDGTPGVFVGSASGGGISTFAQADGDLLGFTSLTVGGAGRVSVVGSRRTEKEVATGFSALTNSFRHTSGFRLSAVTSASNAWFALLITDGVDSFYEVGQLRGQIDPFDDWWVDNTGYTIDPRAGFGHLSDDFAITSGGTVAYSASDGVSSYIFRGGAVIAGPGTGRTVTDLRFSMNEGGDVAFIGSEGGRQGVYVVAAGSGIVRLVAEEGTGGYSRFSAPPSIANDGGVVFAANSEAGDGLFSGPDPFRDALVLRGDVVDGVTIASFVAPRLSPRAVNSSGQVAFRALLEGGGEGIFVANATPPPPPEDVHWDAPAGGAFDEPANWLEGVVPTAALNQNAVFGLDVAYPVTVGSQEVNRIEVVSGGPRLSTTLLRATSLSPEPASVSVVERLVLEAGRLESVHASIGDAERASAAVVEVDSPTSEWITSGRLGVGGVNGGSLLVRNGGRVTSAEARIGPEPGPGGTELSLVSVTHPGSFWASGNLAVGVGDRRAFFDVVAGGEAESGSVTIGADDACISCEVEVSGAPSTNERSYWSVQGELDIGGAGRGRLEVRDGGQVDVFGLTAIGQGGESGVEVTGVAAASAVLRSTLSPLGGLSVGFGPGPATAVVEDGGQIRFLGAPAMDLVIGAIGPGTVTVTGVHAASGNQSRITGADEIVVGQFQPGTLRLLEGADADCRSARIGGTLSPAAERLVEVGGTPGDPSLWTIDEALFVGGGEGGGAGRLELDGGEIEGDGDIRVRSNGVIRGQGGIYGGGVIEIEDGGLVASSLGVPPAASAQSARSAGARSARSTAGTPRRLTIDRDVVFETGSVLELAVGGLAPGLEHDVVDVTGSLTFDGTLVLRFTDGFAPRQGDALALLATRGSMSLGPDQVELRHLAEGFEFELESTAGSLGLTALNDAVYVPEPARGLGALTSLAALALLGARAPRARPPTAGRRVT
ncbi:MAG: hypothetical protein QNK03_21110 [Myxococcota bacterium]|nr:hypothetical protein [Myxococcota bacterium]